MEWDRPQAVFVAGSLVLPPRPRWRDRATPERQDPLDLLGRGHREPPPRHQPAYALVWGLFLYLLPAAAVALWPWSLTPLTARVLGAVTCLGLAGTGALFDRRWSSARLPFQVAGVMLTAILVGGVRAHAEFDPGNVLTWLLAAGFVVVTAAVAAVYWRMEVREQAAMTDDIDGMQGVRALAPQLQHCTSGLLCPMRARGLDGDHRLAAKLHVSRPTNR